MGAILRKIKVLWKTSIRGENDNLQPKHVYEATIETTILKFLGYQKYLRFFNVKGFHQGSEFFLGRLIGREPKER